MNYDPSNRTQVRDKEQRVKLVRDQELSDINEIGQTLAGRRFLWRVLAQLKTFESVWENSARIHYNAGIQDQGHWLMGEITSASPELFLKMMMENKKKEVR